MISKSDLLRFGGVTFDDEYFDEDALIHYGVGKMDGAPGRGSGRYPLGSGENPLQHRIDFYHEVERLRKENVPEIEIAERLGCIGKFGKPSTGILRTRYSNASQELRAWEAETCYRLYQEGLGATEIAKRLGIPNESSVRSKIKTAENARISLNKKTAEMIKPFVDKHKFVDVGAGSEIGLGVSETRLKNALVLLEEEGYKVYPLKMNQAGTNHQTTMKILAAPGVTYNELYANRFNIQSLDASNKVYDADNQLTALGMVKPKSISSDRVLIKYNEEGGIERDGLIQLKRGVDEVSLGNSKYAQVRIAVDDAYYMKGMAVYAEDKEFPPGVDIIYNSNKHLGTPKEKVFKEMKHVDPNDKNSPVDWDNPFGATIKPIEQGGQRYYLDSDGKQQLSVINKVNDQGDWAGWSKSLASQFLSKQPVKLAERQLEYGYLDKKAELDEIKALTNNTVKKKLLIDFAEEADATAVDLKAPPFARQQSYTILPFPELSEKEVYAPNLSDGDRVALVRYPHGGIFEIPELTVRNTGSPADKIIHNAPDAIGIHPAVAAQLSGADFDGDTVMLIPLNDKVRVRTKKPLKDLKDFDPKEEYPGYEGMKKMTAREKQTQMGVITNLITDMTIQGATEDKLARAVKHSMVIIDAEKHGLDYRRSEKVNRIAELKEEFQKKPDGGAGGVSTIISRAGSEFRVPARKDWIPSASTIAPDGSKIFQPASKNATYETAKLNGFELKTGGRVNVRKEGKTGNLYYTKTDSSTGKKVKVYVTQDDFLDDISGKKDVYLNTDKKTGQYYYIRKDPDGGKSVRVYVGDEDLNGDKKVHGKMVESTRMAETKDAFELTSGGSKDNPGWPIERAYANYANNMKALANEARKTWLETKNPERNPAAALHYSAEVAEIKRKLDDARANSPKERMAQRLANRTVELKKAEHPEMTKDELKRCNGQAIVSARARVGAKKPYITLTDKEWEAVQAGAVSHTVLNKVLMNADMEKFRQLATPKVRKSITPTMETMARRMEALGFTTSDIAKRLGISASSVSNIVNKKAGAA